MKKKVSTFVLGVIFTFAMIAMFNINPVQVKADNPIPVTLTSGTGSAAENYEVLQKALETASKTSGVTTVKVTNTSGTYYVWYHGDGDRALYIGSNTVLDLNGVTLARYGSMNNLFQNAKNLSSDGSNMSASTSGTGYTLTTNFTIQNGTLDGTYGTKEQANLLNFGHASGITLSDLTLQNCNSHLVELTGCQNCNVTNCNFKNFTGTVSSSAEEDTEGGEALQLDICNNTAGDTTWNGVYAEGSSSDSTVCKDITVSGCHFYNYPSAVGNHHTLTGHHSSNITITGCYFENSTAWPTLFPAVWAYGFDDSTISGNHFTGKYSTGIYVSGGSVKVTGNEINSSSKEGIYVTEASSYVYGKKNTRTAEYVTGGSVTKNIISGTTKDGVGLSIFSGSQISSVTGNTIAESHANAVIVSGTVTGGTTNTKVTTFSGNVLKSTGTGSKKEGGVLVNPGNGLLIASKARVSKIFGNTIISKDTCIALSSGGDATKIGGSSYAKDQTNNLTSTAGYGILITGSGTSVTDVVFNTITADAGMGISVASKAKVNNAIELNKGTCKQNAIQVTSGATVKYIRKITALQTSEGDGVLVAGSGSTVTSLYNNTFDLVTAKNTKGNGIHVANSGKVTNVYNNTVKSNLSAVLIGSKGSVGTLGKKGGANTLVSKNESGIMITGSGSKASKVLYNKITATGKKGYGISVASKAKVTNEMALNSGTCKLNAIQVTSGASVNKIDKHTKLYTTAGNGILISGSGSTVTSIYNNTFDLTAKKNTVGYGISLGNKAKVTNIYGNTIKTAKNGIQVNSGSTVNIIGKSGGANKIISSKEAGIYVSASTVKKIDYNKIAASNKSSGNGIYITNAKVTGEIYKNTIDAKHDGIRMTSKANVKAIKKNTIKNAKDYGIYASGASQFTIYTKANKNIFTKCKHKIFLSSDAKQIKVAK